MYLGETVRIFLFNERLLESEQHLVLHLITLLQCYNIYVFNHSFIIPHLCLSHHFACSWLHLVPSMKYLLFSIFFTLSFQGFPPRPLWQLLASSWVWTRKEGSFVVDWPLNQRYFQGFFCHGFHKAKIFDWLKSTIDWWCWLSHHRPPSSQPCEI